MLTTIHIIIIIGGCSRPSFWEKSSLCEGCRPPPGHLQAPELNLPGDWWTVLVWCLLGPAADVA